MLPTRIQTKGFIFGKCIISSRNNKEFIRNHSSLSQVVSKQTTLPYMNKTSQHICLGPNLNSQDSTSFLKILIPEENCAAKSDLKTVSFSK